MNDQLQLLEKHPHEELFPYWREQLKKWPSEVFYYRHARDCTGWSMALQGFLFARLLFGCAQMSKSEFRRWWKFNRRIQNFGASK